MKLSIHTTIDAPLSKVWDYYNDPNHIMLWNHASDDWTCLLAENDLRVGGVFSSRMEAKDGSSGFNFGGTYTVVIPNERITYTMADGRVAETDFSEVDDKTTIATTFDAEKENPEEMQRNGWQAILNNFKKYVESN